LKFRAPARTNDIIHDVCQSLRVPVVSSDSLFQSLDPSGFPGSAVFWEHLHPNARGYYLIAGLFLRKIVDLGLLPPAPADETQKSQLSFNPDSLSIPWLDEAYAELSIRFLTSRWPFLGYASASPLYDSAGEALQQIANEVYTHVLGWNEGCYRTAHYFESRGDYRKARTTYESLIEEYPRNATALYFLGNLEKANGHSSSADAAYRKAIAANPRFELPRIDLALLEINAGEYDGAIRQLDTAESLISGQNVPLVKATIYYALSACYANKSDYPRALRLVERSLELAPSYRPAQTLRDNLVRYR
jgi:tetratricopeptide (TPR) repeat protein